MPNKNPSFYSNRKTDPFATVTPTKCGDQWGVWTFDNDHLRPRESGDVVIVRSKSGKSWLAKLTKQVDRHKWLTAPYSGQMEIIAENHSGREMTLDFYPVHSSNFFSMKASLWRIHSTLIGYTADCMVG